MVDAIFPSKDPADTKSLGGGFKAIFRKLLENTDGQLPAIVISYNRTKNIAKVMPLIQRLDTAGKPIDRATIASVPVLALGGGGYFINFPLQIGDKGWIEASDRDISLFMQSGQKKSKPNTFDIHDFSSGRFIPDVFKKYTIAGDDSGAMVLGTLDGSQKIAIDNTGVRITAVRIDINGALWLNGHQYLLHSHPDPQGGDVGNVIP